jgi:hypothetical protein
MYTPGEPITTEMLPTERAFYGIPGMVQFCSDLDSSQQRECSTFQSNDASFCHNVPEHVSRTPYFPSSIYDISNGGAYTIRCGATPDWTIYDQYKNEGAPEGTEIVYTTDGTLPDIYGPRHPNPVQLNLRRSEVSFIVARCIEPGKHPSRIAYVERKYNGPLDCGGKYNPDPAAWRVETDHKPLVLPGCNARALGRDVCDGQTIVEQATSIAPPPPPTSDLSPGPLPSQQQGAGVDAKSSATTPDYSRSLLLVAGFIFGNALHLAFTWF